MRPYSGRIFTLLKNAEDNIMSRKALGIAGAYVAWIMGSGFATGQEIFQFFTSYGYKSFIILTINLVGFLLVGTEVLEAGQRHRLDENFNHFEYYCGKKLGTFYSWFMPLNMFGILIVMVSGAGTALNEYFGLSHVVGAFIMAALTFMSYTIGFKRFVRIVSFIGPVIIGFTLIVGLVTVIRNSADISGIGSCSSEMEEKQPVPFWWLSALLYISYNLWAGSKYYFALGSQAPSVKDAKAGAVMGTIAIMLGILLMNIAMMTDMKNVLIFGVPTLYLARQISYVLGALFSVILLMGIFSASSAMIWMICDKFTVQGTRKGNITAAVICISVFLLGLLPFASLIGVLYTFSGYAGFILIGGIIYRRFKGTE